MPPDTLIRAFASMSGEGRYEMRDLTIALPRLELDALEAAARDLTQRDGWDGWTAALVARRIIEIWIERHSI